MLQRAASSAYSWWWASHIRTKQSKWLEQNLQDMEDKVGSMLGIIDEDGDSFARRAEMYYKKRPELVHLVEESFRAYRALAERYDHISRDLQSANRTIATVYPEKVHYSAMDDDDDEEEEKPGQGGLKKPARLKENGTLKPPIPNVPPIKSFKQLPTFKTKKWTQAQQQQKQQKLKRTISSAKALPCSGLSKGEAMEEIDELQKGILGLQTEKEFVKSIYENAVAKYMEIERRINEMQVRVCGLQDEFGIGTVIEDNVARKLMVSAALKSCQDTLNRLKDKQGNIVIQAIAEQAKVTNTVLKFQALKGEESDKVAAETDNVTLDLESFEEKIKELEEADANKSLTVIDLVDKIDEIVDKVVNLETDVASSTAMVERLKSEADELQEYVKELETNKDQTDEDSDSDIIQRKMVEVEVRMARVHNLKQSVQVCNGRLIDELTRAGNSLEQLAEKVESFKFDEMDDGGWNGGGKYDNEKIVFREKHSKISKERKGEKFLDVVSQILTTSSTKSGSVLSPDVEGQNSDVQQCRENMLSTENGNSGDDDGLLSKNMLETTVADQSSVVLVDQLLPEDSPFAVSEESDQNPSADAVCRGVESTLLADNEDIDQLQMESVIPDDNAEAVSEEQDDEKLKAEDGKSSWRKLVENKDGELDWRRLFLSGLEDREKFLVDEYTSVIKTLKEARRKLSDVEKKNREGLTEQASKLKQIMHANSLKDKEIQSLRRTLSVLQSNITDEKDDIPLPDTSLSEQSKASNDPEVLISEMQPTRLEINLNAEPHIVSSIEEKFRSDLDEMLGENLEFWLRFCTSVHQIQKFQSSIEDLQIEAARILESKKHGSTSNSKSLESLKSDAKPIYKHLKDIQAELNLWLQHNSLLKEELESRHSSLSDIEEDITRLSNVTEDSDLSEYQAAKFQGEVANMKQENNKVADELQSCVGRVKRLEADIDKILLNLNKEFEISESERKHSRTRVPLRTFLFGVRLKKQKHSFFRCISPSLQKQYSDLASQFPPPR